MSLVLIVDDNDKNAKLARDVLRAAGVDTLEAATAGEGIALAIDHRPDVILLDVRLPDLDGVEAARRLKEDGRTAAIPVVALTASTGSDALLAAGFDGYLEKPITVRTFPAQVLAWVRGGVQAP